MSAIELADDTRIITFDLFTIRGGNGETFGSLRGGAGGKSMEAKGWFFSPNNTIYKYIDTNSGGICEIYFYDQNDNKTTILQIINGTDGSDANRITYQPGINGTDSIVSVQSESIKDFNNSWYYGNQNGVFVISQLSYNDASILSGTYGWPGLNNFTFHSDNTFYFDFIYSLLSDETYLKKYINVKNSSVNSYFELAADSEVTYTATVDFTRTSFLTLLQFKYVVLPIKDLDSEIQVSINDTDGNYGINRSGTGTLSIKFGTHDPVTVTTSEESNTFSLYGRDYKLISYNSLPIISAVSPILITVPSDGFGYLIKFIITTGSGINSSGDIGGSGYYVELYGKRADGYNYEFFYAHENEGESVRISTSDYNIIDISGGLAETGSEQTLWINPEFKYFYSSVGYSSDNTTNFASVSYTFVQTWPEIYDKSFIEIAFAEIDFTLNIEEFFDTINGILRNGHFTDKYLTFTNISVNSYYKTDGPISYLVPIIDAHTFSHLLTQTNIALPILNNPIQNNSFTITDSSGNYTFSRTKDSTLSITHNSVSQPLDKTNNVFTIRGKKFSLIAFDSFPVIQAVTPINIVLDPSGVLIDISLTSGGGNGSATNPGGSGYSMHLFGSMHPLTYEFYSTGNNEGEGIHVTLTGYDVNADISGGTAGTTVNGLDGTFSINPSYFFYPYNGSSANNGGSIGTYGGIATVSYVNLYDWPSFIFDKSFCEFALPQVNFDTNISKLYSILRQILTNSGFQSDYLLINHNSLNNIYSLGPIIFFKPTIDLKTVFLPSRTLSSYKAFPILNTNGASFTISDPSGNYVFTRTAVSTLTMVHNQNSQVIKPPNGTNPSLSFFYLLGRSYQLLSYDTFPIILETSNRITTEPNAKLIKLCITGGGGGGSSTHSGESGFYNEVFFINYGAWNYAILGSDGLPDNPGEDVYISSSTHTNLIASYGGAPGSNTADGGGLASFAANPNIHYFYQGVQRRAENGGAPGHRGGLASVTWSTVPWPDTINITPLFFSFSINITGPSGFLYTVEKIGPNYDRPYIEEAVFPDTIRITQLNEPYSYKYSAYNLLIFEDKLDLTTLHPFNLLYVSMGPTQARFHFAGEASRILVTDSAETTIGSGKIASNGSVSINYSSYASGSTTLVDNYGALQLRIYPYLASNKDSNFLAYKVYIVSAVDTFFSQSMDEPINAMFVLMTQAGNKDFILKYSNSAINNYYELPSNAVIDYVIPTIDIKKSLTVKTATLDNISVGTYFVLPVNSTRGNTVTIYAADGKYLLSSFFHLSRFALVVNFVSNSTQTTQTQAHTTQTQGHTTRSDLVGTTMIATTQATNTTTSPATYKGNLVEIGGVFTIGQYRYKLIEFGVLPLLIPVSAPCLLKGTLILTPSGFEKIEYLNVGSVILNHEKQPVEIKKISNTLVQWKTNQSLDKELFKITNPETVFLTSYHKIRGPDGRFLEAMMSGLPLAKKTEVCTGDFYEIFHIHVDDWTNNHLIVNGGTVVESWSGEFST